MPVHRFAPEDVELPRPLVETGEKLRRSNEGLPPERRDGMSPTDFMMASNARMRDAASPRAGRNAREQALLTAAWKERAGERLATPERDMLMAARITGEMQLILDDMPDQTLFQHDMRQRRRLAEAEQTIMQAQAQAAQQQQPAMGPAMGPAMSPPMGPPG